MLDELSTVTPGSIDELTLMAGYNEGAEYLKSGIQAVLDLARSKRISHVTWLNFCTCSSYVGPAFLGNAPNTYDDRNTYLMQRAAQSNGYLSVVDWGSINDSDPGYTVSDRSHLTAKGAVRVANLMAQAIEFIWAGQASHPVADLTQPQTEASRGAFTGVTPPVRLLDTRGGVDGSGLPQVVLGGEALRVQVPVAGATAAVVNVTTVHPDGAGYLTAYPCTQVVPVASFSNFSTGHDVANTTTVKLDANGGFCVFSSASAHLVVDLYATLGAVGDGFIPTDPVRIYDSRSVGATLTRPAAITVGASSLHGNVTITSGTAGFATVWPGTGDGTCSGQPNTSLVNWSDDTAVANRIDIALPKGELCVATSSPAHVIIDSYGRYDALGATVEVEAPTRLFDSRSTPSATAFAIATNSARPTVTVNLVSISATAGYTTIWSAPSCGSAPTASLTNQSAGAPKANSIQLRNEGQLCVLASSKIDLIIDLD